MTVVWLEDLATFEGKGDGDLDGFLAYETRWSETWPVRNGVSRAWSILSELIVEEQRAARIFRVVIGGRPWKLQCRMQMGGWRFCWVRFWSTRHCIRRREVVRKYRRINEMRGLVGQAGGCRWRMGRRDRHLLEAARRGDIKKRNWCRRHNKHDTTMAYTSVYLSLSKYTHGGPHSPTHGARRAPSWK